MEPTPPDCGTPRGRSYPFPTFSSTPTPINTPTHCAAHLPQSLSKTQTQKSLSLPKMASNLLHFRPSVIGALAVPNSSSDHARRKIASANWWTPLFGWASEPDYIDNSSGSDSKEKAESASESKAPRSHRFALGCFTEEKAKRLRMLTKETESFHDVMYHSAIASRLASDFSNSSDF